MNSFARRHTCALFVLLTLSACHPSSGVPMNAQNSALKAAPREVTQEPPAPPPREFAADKETRHKLLAAALLNADEAARRSMDGSVIELVGRMTRWDRGDEATERDDVYHVGIWGSTDTIPCRVEDRDRGNGSIMFVVIGGLCRVKGRLKFEGARASVEEAVLLSSNTTVADFPASATVLAEEFKAAESLGDPPPYVNSVITVKGTVQEISVAVGGFLNTGVVILEGGRGVACFMRKTQEELKEKYAIGSEASITGYCTGPESTFAAISSTSSTLRGCVED
ncbi:hypothetical protein EDM80_13285 [bacterium]|nr:MAG: hypothetical protein EDM80_13285 [bacterium]RIK62046.1 MAG: hypothetical protein DCC64_11055 [Planctomycetota bacterium]